MKNALNFPRVPVTIDGETLDLLFDTGAASFIAASAFEKWRAKHPNWRVIERAENGSGEAMIEVPQVTIAGYTARRGPVHAPRGQKFSRVYVRLYRQAHRRRNRRQRASPFPHND